MGIIIFFVAFAFVLFSLVVAAGLNKISNSLDVLANHLEHSCNKCKTEAEEETSD